MSIGTDFFLKISFVLMKEQQDWQDGFVGKGACCQDEQPECCP